MFKLYYDNFGITLKDLGLKKKARPIKSFTILYKGIHPFIIGSLEPFFKLVIKKKLGCMRINILKKALAGVNWFYLTPYGVWF